MYLLLFILILVALILVHECGHFLAAKFFGIPVEEFGVGFPPRIAAIKKGGTEYSVNWLFIGGFVKIVGQESRSRVVQAVVLLAGVVFNILFAWLALSAGYMTGLPASTSQAEAFRGIELREVHTTIVAVLPGSPASKAGLLAGDVVQDVQTGSASLFSNSPASEVEKFIANHQNESILLQVLREGKQQEFLAVPESGFATGKKIIGVQLDNVGVLQLPPHRAMAQGAVLAWHMTTDTALGLGGFLKNIFFGAADFSSVAGPIGIASIGAVAVKSGFATAIILTALISINLAIINLLPIPGLDGGRLLIIILEGITRRSVPQKFSTVLTLTCMALLLLLMLVVSAHDIARLVG